VARTEGRHKGTCQQDRHWSVSAACMRVRRPFRKMLLDKANIGTADLE